MINIESVTKSFAGNILLDNTGFRINYGEKIGLVGRNGHGKTTLLQMITGDQEPDKGEIQVPVGYRIGSLPQKITFSRKSVLEEGMLGLLPPERDHYWKVEKVLAGLGFSQEDMQRDPAVFSGGFQVRLNLAKVLVSDPDLLILDEPTNYLDITSIRWVSRFLQSWPRELLIVTHDRGFMDSVVTHISGIHRKKIKKIEGNTEKYYEQIAKDEEIYEKTRLNEEKKEKETEIFINRFRAKARLAGLVQSRIKSLEKSSRKEKLHKMEKLRFAFNYAPFAGKQVLKAENLAFSYDQSSKLINDVSLTVYPGDRVGIIGQNGRGKTTLLKLLAENISPGSGRVTYNPGVGAGYFEQTNISSLSDDLTVEAEIWKAHPDLRRTDVRNICGAMMFSGDEALKRIKVLSGGEKSRVMLGKLLVTPLNLLLLDEPTNHLDMESCDAFNAALDAFEGAVVIVTHNEMFLNTLANRLVIFHNGRIDVFEGGYQEFLEKEGWGEEEKGALNNNRSGEAAKQAFPKKKLRQMRSEVVAERSKKIKSIEIEMAEAEKRINKLETHLEGLNKDLLAAIDAADGGRIEQVSVEIARERKRLDALYEELEEYLVSLEREKERFDKKLRDLESG